MLLIFTALIDNMGLITNIIGGNYLYFKLYFIFDYLFKIILLITLKKYISKVYLWCILVILGKELIVEILVSVDLFYNFKQLYHIANIFIYLCVIITILKNERQNLGITRGDKQIR